MRLILAGSGFRSRHWLDVASRRRKVEIAAIVESDPTTAAADMNVPEGVSVYTALEQALETGADAAIIASPPAVRSRQAIEALNAGLAVMIESPVALAVAEAAEVFGLAKKLNRPILVARSSRFSWAQERLREFVKQGRLGRITHMSVADRRKPVTESGWRAETDYVQLLDRGIDQFDGARSVLGLGALSLMAEARKAPWSAYRHGSTTQAMIEMEDGVHVHYFGSLTASRDEHETWLEGEKGVLWTDERLIWWRKRGWPRFIPLVVKRPRVSPQQTRRILLEELKSAMQKPMHVDGATDALRTLAMLEAAVQSDRTGRVVPVAEVAA